MHIDGKTALVTGAASGLGRASAEALLQAGGNVVVVDLPSSGGESAVPGMGDRAVFAPADVTAPTDIEAAIDVAVDRFGGLHIVVNCAGIAWAQRTVTREGPHDFDAFRKVLNVNLAGTFNVMRLAAARISSQDPDGEERGVIVNTASIAAFDGQIGQVAYAASKAGVAGMTLPAARDLAARQIRVVTIAPGTFDTPMLAGLPEGTTKALADQIPHPHRLGKPEEFGLLVRQIVENPSLNGEVIRLDGALRMPPR